MKPHPHLAPTLSAPMLVQFGNGITLAVKLAPIAAIVIGALTLAMAL